MKRVILLAGDAASCGDTQTVDSTQSGINAERASGAAAAPRTTLRFRFDRSPPGHSFDFSDPV